jgi:hypothetical protein
MGLRLTPSENFYVVATLVVGALLGVGVRVVVAQDVQLNVTYVCNGEREYVESCNVRDLSDVATCMVAHPDRPQHNGFMAYTTETRGTLKALFPTCGGVLVNCAGLSPDQHSYKLEFESDRTVLRVDTTPKPLVLTLREDGTSVGPVPVALDGVVATGVERDGADPNASSGLTDAYGTSPYKYLGIACGQHTAECLKIISAVQADTASAMRADAQGKGTMPGVPAGTYYLMIDAV